MGPAGSCILTFFEDFEAPRRSPKSRKITTNGVSTFCVFLECLLERFGSQVEAKTIQNDPKSESKRDKSRPPKTHRFYNEKTKEKCMEISSSNKHVENVET